MKRFIQNNPTDFVWFIYKANTPLNISPQSLTKLFMLGCLISDDNSIRATLNTEFDGEIITNCLVATHKRVLQEILRVSDRTLLRFMKESLSSGYLYQNDEGIYCVSDKYFKKHLSKKDLADGEYAIKINIAAYTAFYDYFATQSHKKMSYFLQLIPYINVNNNVLCSNIFESSKKVNPLSWDDFCNLIDYGADNLRRIRNTLCSFTLNGKQLISQETNNGVKCIIINPCLMYFKESILTEEVTLNEST